MFRTLGTKQWIGKIKRRHWGQFNHKWYIINILLIVPYKTIPDQFLADGVKSATLQDANNPLDSYKANESIMHLADKANESIMDLASGYGMDGNQLCMVYFCFSSKQIIYFDCKIIQTHLLVYQ
jgi:hypothetical protein